MNDLITHHSIEARIATYEVSVARMREAWTQMRLAEDAIREAFGGESGRVSFEIRNAYNLDSDQFDKVAEQMERQAWRSIVAQSGVRGVMSCEAAKQMDHQLEHDKLPALTAENVRGLMKVHAEKAQDYLADAVREVHDFLRPTRSRYKTNTEFDIGKRVILGNMVRKDFMRWQTSYWGRASDQLRALDRVFALLDGKAPPTTYYGPLYDSITTSEADSGETVYFRWKAFLNGNLHLEFRRMDLVAKLNAVAGGNRLYAGGAR